MQSFQEMHLTLDFECFMKEHVNLSAALRPEQARGDSGEEQFS